MNEGIKTIIYPVKDITQAKKLYGELLGADPVMDESYYVGFNVADQHVGLDPNGHAQGMTGPIGYYHVDDIRKSVDQILAAGGKTQQQIKDVGGGKLIAWVADPDGNVIGLSQSP